MINTNKHASLVEIAGRTGKRLSWLQAWCKDPTVFKPDGVFEDPEYGWLVERDQAEILIANWKRSMF